MAVSTLQTALSPQKLSALAEPRQCAEFFANVLSLLCTPKATRKPFEGLRGLQECELHVYETPADLFYFLRVDCYEIEFTLKFYHFICVGFELNESDKEQVKKLCKQRGIECHVLQLLPKC